MRTPSIACFVLTLVLMLGAPAYAAKWALLVGVNDYDSADITRLNYAVDDVKAVAGDLVSRASFPQANVIVMTSDAAGNGHPTNINVLKRLDTLARRIQPGDTFLFYFSGHGFIREGGQHFLATTNADPTSIETLQLSSLPMALMRERMAKIKATSVIFIIDACRNDPEAGKGGGDNVRTPGFTRDLKSVITSSNGGQAGTALLFACGERERSYEEPTWKHGVFTHYFLEGLETGKAVDGDGAITMASLAQYVQNGVATWADENDKQQHPDLQQQGAARIILEDHAAKVAARPVVTPPVVPVVIPEPPHVDPPPTRQSTTITAVDPDPALKSAIVDLLGASVNRFESLRGMNGFTEIETLGTWTVYTSRRKVPGFKDGLIHIHARGDGNYYDLGNYAEFENSTKWKADKSADAADYAQHLTAEVAGALGDGWTYKPIRSDDGSESGTRFTRATSPSFVSVRQVRDAKGHITLFLDVSDGMH